MGILTNVRASGKAYFASSKPLLVQRFVSETCRDNKFLGKPIQSDQHGLYVELSIGIVRDNGYVVSNLLTGNNLFILKNKQEYDTFISVNQSLYIDDDDGSTLDDILETLINHVKDNVDGSKIGNIEGLKKLIEARHWFKDNISI